MIRYSKHLEGLWKVYWFVSLSVLVVLVIASYEYALETLYLAKGEGMINGEFAFIIFQLNQLEVTRAKKLNFWWFYHTLLAHKRLVGICQCYIIFVLSANCIC